MVISPDAGDFVEPPRPLLIPITLGGMARGMMVAGTGIVSWTFTAKDGTEIEIRTNAYYVPTSGARLLSPQRLFCKRTGSFGYYSGDQDSFELKINDHCAISTPYDLRSGLPIAHVYCGTKIEPSVNLTILEDEKQNLTAGQKLALEWHYRFGHLNFYSLQDVLRNVPFVAARFVPATKCDSPKCTVCEFAKGKRRAKKAETQVKNPERDGALKANFLRPGSRVSVDHFESRFRIRMFDSFGKTTSDQYVGGCIFVDHALSYVHIEHQLGFSAVETIRAKQAYKKLCLDHGVLIQDYLTDSGAFKANKFVQHIRESHHLLRFCGTNAHHQNGVAERAIQTISNMSRAMILHACLHWKNGIDSSLWPMAVKYAAQVYNHIPKLNGVCPTDFFSGSTVPRHRLLDLHVWGCPVYVLDPNLQQGQKLLRWQPRSRQGIFMGLSTQHASEVPLVLNCKTGSITTQFHVVFDDLFFDGSFS
jgi:hypothetical protein